MASIVKPAKKEKVVCNLCTHDRVVGQIETYVVITSIYGVIGAMSDEITSDTSAYDWRSRIGMIPAASRVWTVTYARMPIMQIDTPPSSR